MKCEHGLTTKECYVCMSPKYGKHDTKQERVAKPQGEEHMSIEAMKQALQALENNKRTHHYCEDSWYSCPKHEDGCANDSEGDECNCGADKANAEIDAAITSLRQAIEQASSVSSIQSDKTSDAEKQEPVNWSVYNSGAEVASGLTFSEAWDYLTPERLAREWCAVCVVDQSNMPTTPQPQEKNT